MKLRICNSPKGFTLIETLIAMLIMAGAVLVIGNAWSGNANRISKSRINTIVASLLQKKMTEIELEYRDKRLDEVADEDAGDFGKEYAQYTWNMKSKPFDMPDLKGVLTARDGGANEMLLTIVSKMTEYFSKAVKEVTVTIIYKAKGNKREIKNSATTYFVDYKTELPLDGLSMPAGMGGGGAAPGGATGASSSGGGASQ